MIFVMRCLRLVDDLRNWRYFTVSTRARTGKQFDCQRELEIPFVYDWISSKIDGCAAASGDERVSSACRLLFIPVTLGNLPHPHLRITVSPP